MASITSAGVGSGLDIEGILTKLMEAERTPLVALQTKETAYEAQISAYGKLTSAISTFRNSLTPLDRATDYKVFSSTSSSESVVTASTSISAAAGQYAVEVYRIAENHKRAATVGYANSTVAEIGVDNDYMTFTQGPTGSQSTFTVSFGGKTLEQIQAEINTASDNTGVTASIVKGDGATPYKIVLTADETGQNGHMTMGFGIDPFELADESAGAGMILGGAKYYADADTTVIGRTGDVMTINGTNVDIGNKTLNQVRDEINLLTGTHNVTASVESGDDGYRLVLTSASAITKSYTSSATLADLFSFQDLNVDRANALGAVDGVFNRDDLDGIFKVDGTVATRGSNTISDVVTGLTFSLKGAGTSTIKISRDMGTVETRLTSFATAYNTFMDSLDDLNETDLKNDATLRSVVSQVRSRMNAKAEGFSIEYLTHVGISFVLENRTRTDGTDMEVSRLEVDEDIMSSALTTNFEDVASLLSDSSEGILRQLDATLNNFVKSNGFLEARTDGLTALIDGLTTQQDRMQTRLAILEVAYRKQFTAMDALVASMKATSDFLTQQLNASSK